MTLGTTIKIANRLLRPLGYEISRSNRRELHHGTVLPYAERPEFGPSNLDTKLENVARGHPFEYPDIVKLNQAVVTLVGDAERICELGCGTGKFATAVVQEDGRTVVASEYDPATFQWVSENRAHPRIEYTLGAVPEDAGPFDLLVAIEVIEHIADYAGFLETCRRLAPRALITTPNRARGPETFHAGPPPYPKHVREWTAGEFYWVLRSFYDRVTLYALPDPLKTNLVRVSVDTSMSSLIADCRAAATKTFG